MKKLTLQNLKHLKRHTKKQLQNSVRRRYKIYQGPKSQVLPHWANSTARTLFKPVHAPKKFNLQYENCSDVIFYVNEIKRLGQKGKNINVILDEVEDIGEGAIAMLLSVCEELKKKGVLIKGTKPKIKREKDILEKSGFFKYVNGQVDENNKISKNTILRTGGPSDTVNIAEEIRKANETVWGDQGRNPPLRGTVFEMMRNSCDHAFKNKNSVKWHFAISHDDINNQVKFSFVDNGRGIIKSFTEGLLNKVISLFNDNVDLLDTAFKNGIESRTGLSWRGKGLPTIYENYNDGYFKNLIVISNDVFIDFDRGVTKKLKVPFSGTYYYWILNNNCIKACYN